MSVSSAPNLKAQFEEQYACSEPAINEAAVDDSCCICSCND